MTSAVDPDIITAEPVDKAQFKNQLQIIKDEISALQLQDLATIGEIDHVQEDVAAVQAGSSTSCLVWATADGPSGTPITTTAYSPWSDVDAPIEARHVSGTLVVRAKTVAATSGQMNLIATLTVGGVENETFILGFPVIQFDDICLAMPFAFSWTEEESDSNVAVYVSVNASNIPSSDVRLVSAQVAYHFTR